VRSAVAFGVMLALLGVGASTASAQTVQCGRVVAQDVTLDSDLTCDPPALIIGADDVSVDLNGHTISSAAPTHGVGIENTAGHDGVTVRDGTISAFFTGIALTGASRNQIVNIRSDALVGISIREGSENEVRGTRAEGLVHGIEVNASDHVRIVRSSGSAAFGSGIRVAADSGLIAFNRVGLDPSDISVNGIDVGGTGNRIVGNEARFAYSANIFIAGSRHIVLGNGATDARRARFSPAANGLVVWATDTLVAGNRASRNQDDGINVGAPGARLIGNVANDNGAVGIRAVPGVFGVGNRASGNGDRLQCLNAVCR
jgi:hypothetical protein